MQTSSDRRRGRIGDYQTTDGVSALVLIKIFGGKKENDFPSVEQAQAKVISDFRRRDWGALEYFETSFNRKISYQYFSSVLSLAI